MWVWLFRFMSSITFYVCWKVWAAIPNEGGPVYFLGPTPAEHPQQAVLPDGQRRSRPGSRFTPVFM